MSDPDPQPNGSTEKSYHYALNRQQFGPVPESELRDLIRRGTVRPNDLVWTSGLPDWVEVRAVEGLMPTEGIPPASPRASVPSPATPWQEAAPGATLGPPSPAMPPPPYTPESISKLYTWWLVLTISGVVLLIVLVGFLVLIAATVVGCILTYRSWRVIQDGHARTGPGRAVGFSFIPFFNLYWMFVAIHGYSIDANRFMDRHNLPCRRMSTGVALTLCILAVATCIPYVGLLAAIPEVVFAFMFMHDMQRAAKGIVESKYGSAF